MPDSPTHSSSRTPSRTPADERSSAPPQTPSSTRSQGTEHPRSGLRAGYRHFLALPTRWLDNDSYGHVNNVTYYSYFDTAVNEHLIRAGGLDIAKDPVVGFVVETRCHYRKPLSFPETIDVGLRVVKLGTSSVKYEIGIFRQGDDEPAATGHFVHVWVDRSTLRPAALPPRIRAALEPLVVEAHE